MKYHVIISSIILLALAACSTSYHSTSRVDDIYYTPELVRPGGSAVHTDAKTVEVPKESVSPVENQIGYQNNETGYTQSDYATDEDGNVYISNYFYGDVYDYAYSSRIRRFYSPHTYSSYYDPFFTNMYWYNFDPFYSGVSIYMGYGAFPFYYPGYFHSPYSWGMGWGHPVGWMYSPYSRFGYWHSWYSPFHRHSPYSFMSAYHYGFSSGYYMGLYNNPYYYQYLYNSYDRSNYHYGPRQAVGSSTRLRGAPSSTGSAGTFADRFETATTRSSDGRRVDAATTTRTPSRSDTRSVSPVKSDDEPASTRPQRGATTGGQTMQPRTGDGATGRTIDTGSREAQGESTRPVRGTQPITTGEGQTVTRPQSTPQTSPSRSRPDAAGQATQTRPQASPERQQDLTRPQAPTQQRYVRPEQTRPTSQSGEVQPNYTPPRTYTSPSYQQPRSNEQYRNPQTARPPSVTPPREAAAPTREQPPQTRQQVQPQARPAPPTRQPQARPQQAPTRSQPAARPASTPTRAPRSTPSVSPSRSSGSSAAPARSSGSSGSTRSSSGSSSSGRRR